MTTNTDYAISKADARELRGIDLLPAEIRVMGLRRYQRDHGTEALLQLFAEFVGLANSVVASNRQFIEVFAITECDLHPERVHELNLPTVNGALNGILNAIAPARGMCEGCAFRLGTPANQSPITSCDAGDSVSGAILQDFVCHMKPDRAGECHTQCAGYRAARKAGAHAARL